MACCAHGRSETVAAFHCKFLEGAVNSGGLATLLRQLATECELGALRWLPLSEAVISRLTRVYASLLPVETCNFVYCCRVLVHGERTQAQAVVIASQERDGDTSDRLGKTSDAQRLGEATA